MNITVLGIDIAKNTYALDTGCVWGFKLTAMRLEDEMRFSVGCNNKSSSRTQPPQKAWGL